MSVRIKGYNKYFLRLLLSFLLVVLIPVVVMGVIWYGMIRSQERRAFLKNERDRVMELSVAIEREINDIESGLAILQLDLADRGYNVSDPVRSNILMSKSLSKFIKDYRVLYSVYFFETSSGRIFSTASGYYSFSEYYDTEWFVPSKTQYYSKRLPPRYNCNAGFLKRVRDTGMEAIYPYRKVLTIVTAGASGDYIAANINIEGLYQTVAKSYRLNQGGERLYFIGPHDEILYGPDPDSTATQFPVPDDRSGDHAVRIAYRDGVAYFIVPLAYRDLYCAISFPEAGMLTVSGGYGMYIAGICAFLVLLLFIVSRIMANGLYKPIRNLCSEIRRTPSGSSYDEREGEIETLRRVFKEMETICVTAEQRAAEYRATMLHASFRLLLDGLITKENFLAGNSAFFAEVREYRFRIVMCKFIERPRGTDGGAFELFFGRFCELIENYLQAVARGVFAAMDADSFAVMYACPNDGDLDGIKDLLMKTVGDLAEYDFCLFAGDGFGIDSDFGAVLAAARRRVVAAAFFGVSGTLPPNFPSRVDGPVPRGDGNAYASSLKDAIEAGNSEFARKQLSALRGELIASGNPAHATDVCETILGALVADNAGDDAPGRDVRRECREAHTLDEMLGILDETIAATMASGHASASMSDYYCAEAKRYLRENYMRYMNITEVADFLGISYPYLSRIFNTQNEGNGKLGEYLNLIRIEKSKEFLSTTNESLQCIARKVGYGNVQSFQRFFKKYERITPGDYRKMHIARK